MQWFVNHPYVTFGIAVIGLVIGVLSLVEPRFEVVTDGEICGFNENTVVHRDHEFQLCRDPSHPIESYRFSEAVSGSSGWRGGGYNQVAWCNDVKRAKERAVGESIVWGVEQRGENSKKDWKGRAEYNYHCTIQAQWGPIFQAHRSEMCGPEPYTESVEKSPKSCMDETKRIGWKWSWL